MKKIITTALVITSLFTVFNHFDYSITERTEKEFIEYRVKAGDTLWSIAADNKAAKMDIRKVIYDIEKLNDIDQVVYAEQYIKIPVYN